MKPAACLFVIGLTLLALPADAHAVKLYKWIDDAGRVTYQDRPPPSRAATIEEKEINPNQNTADSYVPPPSSAPESPAPSARRVDDDTDAPASARSDSRQRRRLGQGGGAGDGSSMGGVPPPAPPAPPAPPPSVPVGTGGS